MLEEGAGRFSRGSCRCRRGGAGGAEGAGGGPRACLAVAAGVLLYNLLGALLFHALEGGGLGGGTGEGSVAASQPAPPAAALRARAVERLWAITEDLNILYKENWTRLAARELRDFQAGLLRPPRPAPLAHPTPLSDHRWTFSGSFLYALTLITTIGHGSVTPESAGGKLAAALYACGGVPLVMLYLATLGAALARALRALCARLRPAARPHRAPPPPPPAPATPFQAALNLAPLGAARGATPARRGAARGPAPLSALLLLLYVCGGALLFRRTERWSLLDGGFFAFCSLATIGFGDLRPGAYAASLSPEAEDAARALAALYILVGMVVVAACFDLLRAELGAALRAAAVHPPDDS